MSKPVTSDDSLAARRGYHHGNLREALVEAARRLTAERGPHGFTLAECARLAGVSPSAVYRHFKDRDALLEELCRRGFALFEERLRDVPAGDAAARLTAMGHAYLAFAREEPGHYGAMFSWRPPLREGAPIMGDSFGGLVAAVAAVLPPDAGKEARFLALEIWALSHGIAGLERAGMPPPGSGAPPPERVLEDAVRRLLRR